MKRINQRQLRRMVISEQRKTRRQRQLREVARKADHLLNEQFQMSSVGRQQAQQMVQRSSPDAIAIYKALKGLGTDEDAVYAVLNKRQNSIPQLYEEFSALMVELKQASSGFMGKVKKYGAPFLAGSGLFALATMIEPKKAAAAASKIGGVGGMSAKKMLALQNAASEEAAGSASTGAGAAYAAAEKAEMDRQARAGKAGKATGDFMKSARKTRGWMPDWAKEKGANPYKEIEDMTGGPKSPMRAQPDKVETGELSMGGKIAGAALTGAAVVAVAALISSILPDSLDDDLVDWLEDDGMDDAAQFVAARLQPGQQRG